MSGVALKAVMMNKEFHGLPAVQRSVLMALAYWADGNGKGAFRSRKQMCEHTGLSKTTVTNALKALTEKGIIADGDQSKAGQMHPSRRPRVKDINPIYLKDEKGNLMVPVKVVEDFRDREALKKKASDFAEGLLPDVDEGEEAQPFFIGFDFVPGKDIVESILREASMSCVSVTANQMASCLRRFIEYHIGKGTYTTTRKFNVMFLGWGIRDIERTYSISLDSKGRELPHLGKRNGRGKMLSVKKTMETINQCAEDAIKRRKMVESKSSEAGLPLVDDSLEEKKTVESTVYFFDKNGKKTGSVSTDSQMVESIVAEGKSLSTLLSRDTSENTGEPDSRHTEIPAEIPAGERGELFDKVQSMKDEISQLSSVIDEKVTQLKSMLTVLENSKEGK